jgi:hypothetical protein
MRNAIPIEAGTCSVHLNGAVYGKNITADATSIVTFGVMDRINIYAIYS